jgi:hypothetical protein
VFTVPGRTVVSLISGDRWKDSGMTSE